MIIRINILNKSGEIVTVTGENAEQINLYADELNFTPISDDEYNEGYVWYPSPIRPLKKRNTTNTLTLPTDSAERKTYPLMRGCLNYFPAALAGVANISDIGNNKHNYGQELHHARGKSTDHGDCILRHLMDVQDLLACINREGNSPELVKQVKEEVSSMAWRALAYSQELHEKFGAPLAPGAKE